MSYILDALRKADSERERGAVPTLHSHTEHAAQSARAGTDDRGMALRRLLWGGGALGLLLVAAWLLLRPSDEPAVQTAALPPAALPMQSPALPPTLQSTSQPAPQPAPQPAAPPLTPTLVAPPPALEAAPQPGIAAAPPAPAGSAPVAVAVAAAPAPILKFTDLPEATRKALPTIVTSGAMYSDTPANRMLIVNGQLLHEGDKIAPELLLERIELKSAVLVFKGQRFRISY